MSKPLSAYRRILVTFVVAAVSIAVMVPPAGAAVPRTLDFGKKIDGYANWESENSCSPTAKPGPIAIRDKIIKPTYGNAPFGIVTSCDGTPSAHHQGRALDWVMGTSASGRAEANAFLGWLLATDKYGNKNANARRLGVMYIIYNNRMWRSYRSSPGWGEYKNCAGGGGSASACHRNHIHISLSWAGARKQTSYWSKSVSSTSAPIASAPSSSSTSPTPITGSCGSGFKLVTTAALVDSKKQRGPAELQLYWNNSTKEKCAFTVHTGVSIGKRSTTSVVLVNSAGKRAEDTGRFYEYAGPVKLKAPGCATVTGSLIYNNVKYEYSKKDWCSA